MLSQDFIDSRKKFIAQFDGLVPKNGMQRHIKELAEQYAESLENLEEAHNQVVDIFSLGEINDEKMKRNKEYPAAINAYHGGLSTVLGASLLGAVFIISTYVLGGTNMETWSSSLMATSAGVGAVFGLPPAILSYLSNRKNFNRKAAEKGKGGFIEKRILKRVRAREHAFSLLASKVDNSMEEILSGQFSIKQTKSAHKRKYIFFGPRVPKKVEVYKDEYKVLPRGLRRKLAKVVDTINEEYEILTDIESQLKTRVGEITEEKRARDRRVETPTPKEAPSKNDLERRSSGANHVDYFSEENKKKDEGLDIPDIVEMEEFYDDAIEETNARTSNANRPPRR